MNVERRKKESERTLNSVSVSGAVCGGRGGEASESAEYRDWADNKKSFTDGRVFNTLTHTLSYAL